MRKPARPDTAIETERGEAEIDFRSEKKTPPSKTTDTLISLDDAIEKFQRAGEELTKEQIIYLLNRIQPFNGEAIVIPKERVDEFIKREAAKRDFEKTILMPVPDMPAPKPNGYQRRLTKSIVKVGEWLIQNAADIAGTTEGRMSLDIHLSWECSPNEISPTINIDSDFLCLEAIDEMHRKENEK